MSDMQNQDWLDQIAQQVIKAHPSGKLIVSSGHSPSGKYHIGTLRELMTANAITWALKRAGREAEHWDMVDDFDAIRKLPAGIPESFRQYIGVPLSLVPDPADCHDSYGNHYLQQLNEGLKELGATPDRQLSGWRNYQDGVFVSQIGQVLDRLEEVKQILVEVGGRQLDENWAPVQIMDEQHNLRNRKFVSWDAAHKRVLWRDRNGTTGEAELGNGEVKLDWRLDWPARWAKWNIGVEPFGRDHASKGGSYDTGKVLVERIFGGQAPFPVPYEFINSVGETKKMSKSSGEVLTPKDALEVMPAEVLRYFIIKSRPSRTLSFDSGLGLYTLLDEFSKAQALPPTTALEYARAGSNEDVIAAVPFNHLVAVYQAARQEPAEVRNILMRTGYEDVVDRQWAVVERELGFVNNWLNKYAPEKVKFKVQDKLPETELSPEAAVFLEKLANTIEAENDLNGQGMHDAVYSAAEVARIKPGQAFVALYQILLGQDSGPKAGWFLATLDRNFLLSRLRLKA